MNSYAYEVCPGLHNGNTDSGVVEKLQVQNHCRVVWERLDPSARIEVSPHVEHAVSSVKHHCMTTTDEVVILVIGSVHLVGAFYEVLDLTASIYHHPMD